VLRGRIRRPAAVKDEVDPARSRPEQAVGVDCPDPVPGDATAPIPTSPPTLARGDTCGDRPGEDKICDWGREFAGDGGAGRDDWRDELERGFGTGVARPDDTSADAGRARGVLPPARPDALADAEDWVEGEPGSLGEVGVAGVIGDTGAGDADDEAEAEEEAASLGRGMSRRAETSSLGVGCVIVVTGGTSESNAVDANSGRSARLVP